MEQPQLSWTAILAVEREAEGLLGEIVGEKI